MNRGRVAIVSALMIVAAIACVAGAFATDSSTYKRCRIGNIAVSFDGAPDEDCGVDPTLPPLIAAGVLIALGLGGLIVVFVTGNSDGD